MPQILEILVPPRNPCLRRFVPGKTVLPEGVRVLGYGVGDEETPDGEVRLLQTRAVLMTCAESLG